MTASSNPAAYLKRDDAPDLAYIFSEGDPTLPTVMFLTGFRSDMYGTKALYLEEACRKRNQPYIRFDYRGHGRSGGRFEDGTIGLWTQDALDILESLTQGPVVAVGSSLGGWIALNIAQRRADRITGLVGIAAAPDFTRSVRAGLNPEQQSALMRDGYVDLPNDYSDEPYRFTAALLDDGEQYCLLDRAVAISCPVRLIQGMLDDDVEWQTAHRIKNAIVAPSDADVFLVEQGDHRLSRPEDLALIDRQVRAVSGVL